MLNETGVRFSMASLRLLDQFAIERVLQPVILRRCKLRRPTWLGIGGSYSTAERSMPLAFQCVDVFALHEAIHAANHFVYGAESELRHDLPQILRDEEKEIDHVLGLAL